MKPKVVAESRKSRRGIDMRKVAFAALLAAWMALPLAAQNRTAFGGVRNAIDYAYGVSRPGGASGPAALVIDNANPIPSGSQTVTVSFGVTTAGDGTVFAPLSLLAPVSVGAGTDIETVTPTAVSCSSPQVYDSCTFTATFANAHGRGEPVASASYGLQEALDVSWAGGGGVISIDQPWKSAGGTNATIQAAVIAPFTTIADNRQGPTTYWYPQPAATAILSLPTILSAATAVPSATPAGGFGTGTYYLCVAYVDIMGQEGPCSPSFSEAGVATGSFIFSPPAASTGAVGYTIYISLTSGTYTLAYKVPLTSAVCALTALETTTAACAVANATYGQTGATATVTAITVNTSPILLNETVISTAAISHGTPNGRMTYVYAPGNGVGLAGVEGASFPFTIGAAASTGIPSDVGTINIPPGYMNAVGRKIRVCGFGTFSGASTATVIDINLQWDSFGQNTAGLPVTVASMTATPAAAFAASIVNVSFCQVLTTTVAGAGATAGTILPGAGVMNVGNTVTGISAAGGTNATAAAVGSLNLASEARLHVVYNHTTGTDGSGMILNSLTIEAL